MQKQVRIPRNSNSNFYADYPEIQLISKLLSITIVIYNQTRNRLIIIKHNETTNPIKF